METPSKRHMVVNWIVGLIHFHEPEDFLEIGSLSRANQARLLPIFPAQPSAAYFLCATSAARLVLPFCQAVSTTAFIQVCLGDPVADRLFVGFKLSGQLTGAAPGSMKLDYLLAKLGWISSSCSWHRVLHSPKGLGVHETGGTPLS